MNAYNGTFTAVIVPTVYSSREEWLNAFVAACRPVFASHGAPLPAKVRASIGFTSSGRRGKSIGECWSEANSEDGHFEIFIRPSIDGANRIADILTHELIHAAHGIDEGHKRKFQRTMKALGLIGKATATVAGEGWYDWALPIIAELGALPAARLNDMSSPDKKQKTRLIKCECNDCGLVFRITAKWLDSTSMRCPSEECRGDLTIG